MACGVCGPLAHNLIHRRCAKLGERRRRAAWPALVFHTAMFLRSIKIAFEINALYYC